MFYTLQIRHDQEGSLNMVTSILKVFHLNAYALFGPSDTLSLVTSYVPMRFDVSAMCY